LSPRPRTIGCLLGGLILHACAWQGPALLGYDGLQLKVQRFYNARASERSARCPSPRLTSITRAEVLKDTPEEVEMLIGYHWRDDGQSVDGGGSHTTCQGFGARRFAFTRASDGGLEVASMSGPRPR
jgi:hypothetical protein